MARGFAAAALNTTPARRRMMSMIQIAVAGRIMFCGWAVVAFTLFGRGDGAFREAMTMLWGHRSHAGASRPPPRRGAGGRFKAGS